MGQLIYVLDELNRVVVLTGGDVDAGHTMPGFIMQNFIVPAVKSNTKIKANKELKKLALE